MRDDGNVERSGDSFGGAVSGTGLSRGDVRVRDQVHVGPGNPAGVVGQNDGAVHLRQLGQALGGEGGVEQEPTGADVEDVGSVPDHDQATTTRFEDPIETVPERRTGRYLCQGTKHRTVGPGVHPGHGRARSVDA